MTASGKVAPSRRRRQPRQLRFAKMHGLGNDFMIVDLVTQPVQPTPAQIRAWGDRRTGIGFDQFLAVLPPDAPDMDFRYRIFNADGREVQQCGNGARCFARFVVDAGLTVKRRLCLQTASGAVHTELLPDGVQVDVGVPSIEPQTVPFIAEDGAAPQRQAFCHPVVIDGSCLDLTPVSIGNPHAVIFVDDVTRADVERIGRRLQDHPCFPEQVNVGFLQVVDRGFGRLRVYERGVGETRACGTGACAAVVAGRLHERFDEQVELSLPGGTLRVTWRGAGQTATLAGTAQFVYKGKVTL